MYGMCSKLGERVGARLLDVVVAVAVTIGVAAPVLVLALPLHLQQLQRAGGKRGMQRREQHGEAL